MNSKEVKEIQGGLTNYEFSFILGVTERTVEHWRGGQRTPRGPAKTLLLWAKEILNNGQLTKGQLLRKVGRVLTGGGNNK